MMTPNIINVLLTSFPGLGLPSTLSIPVKANTSISDLRHQLSGRLPQVESRLVLTTTSNKELSSSQAPVASLLSSEHDSFLPLRLSVPLCGGKGGFGSQLRAAGGRMSSRRKTNQGNFSINSNRNLDGRRLRTVNEAKALAEYLALKPEMEKKEKETRRKHWEQVVDLAERREEDIRNGARGKVDGKWVEDKEEAGERTREAVLAAVVTGNYHDNLKGFSNGGFGDSDMDSSDGSEDNMTNKSEQPQTRTAGMSSFTQASTRPCFGFDEDTEFSSDEVEDDQSDLDDGATNHTCKEKGKAAAS